MTRWYDQSGYNNDVYQATTSLQPQIVTTGVVSRLNKQPAIYFGTANLATNQKVLFPQATSMVGFAKGNSTTSSTFVSKTGLASGEHNSSPGPFDFSNIFGEFYVGNASDDPLIATVLSSTTPRSDVSSTVPASSYSFVLPSSGTFYTYLNGIQTTTKSVSGYLDGGNNLRIGNRNDNSGSGNFWTTELILFNSVLGSTDRELVENSQTDYYNSSNADLSALTISVGTLSPAFDFATTAYTVNLEKGINNITITPSKAEIGATIQIQVNNGGYTTVASGSASNALVLNLDNNTIDIKVIAKDGINIKTYTLIVKKPSLDIVGLSSATPATTAYSLRKLSSTYTGKAINVRRSSDNTKLDIGFNTTGGLDTVALKSFVGTGDGFVTRWYDQSGYNNDVYQFGHYLQPQIVTAGVVNRLNKQPVIYFRTANLATDPKVLFPDATSMVGFAKGNSSTPSTFVSKTGLEPSSSMNNYPRPFDFSNSEGKFYVGNASDDPLIATDLSSTTPRSDVSSAVPSSSYSFVLPSSGTFYTYRNGVQTTSNNLSSYRDGGFELRIGNRNDHNGSGNFWTTELILFNSVLSSSDRESVENSQTDYYNSSNADLSALTLSAGTLFPTFASATLPYTASVTNATSSVTATPTQAGANASIQVRVNGGTYATIVSGSASDALSLNVGDNTIDVKVIAQDGITIKTYTVTVTRAKADQTITFPAFASKTTTSPDFEPGATADSGLPLTYTSTNTAVATVFQDNADSGKWKIHILAEGTTDIVASQAGNSDYNSASEVRELVVGSILPVTLTSYQVKIQNNTKVLLGWVTETESNNLGFEIWKSADGKSFKKLAFVKGAENSSTKLSYNYVDLSPSQGENYYKLIQLDKDGVSKEIGLESVRFEIGKSDKISVHPNPTSDVINIKFDAGIYHALAITDLSGKVLLNKAISFTATEIVVSLLNFPNTVYILQLNGKNGAVSTQVVKK